VEPLSLDEAYLDVTRDLRGIGSATRIAELIRQRIRAETGLTASAGVSYNKFLAKLASDQNKPDGLCLIRPGEGPRSWRACRLRGFTALARAAPRKWRAWALPRGPTCAGWTWPRCASISARRPIISIAPRGHRSARGHGRSAAQVGGGGAHVRP
jgi:hypothetical protein